MKRWILLLCLLFTVSSVLGGDRGHKVDFDDPSREEWQQPLTVLDFLGIEPGDYVADLGAGTGYFTRLLVAQVGDEGRVYAVDVKQSMLDHLMAREDIMTSRVVPVLAKRNDPRLPAGEIDLVLVVNTWHHIKKRSAYLERLGTTLSPEGRVVIVDFRKEELPVGPPPGKKLSRDQVVSEFEAASWRHVAESVALPHQYILTFLPPERPDTRRFVSR